LIDNEVRWNFATALKAILERDPDLLIDALIELGAVNLREEGCRTCLRKDVKYVMVHFPTSYLLRPSDSVNFGIGQLFSLLRRNQVQLPSNTFMMLKTIVMVQGLGKGLDPDFDILHPLAFHIKRIIRFSFASSLRHWPSTTAEMISMAGELPTRMNRLLKTFERGEMRVSADVSGVEDQIRHAETLANKAFIGLMAAAILLGLALFFLGFHLGK
jgi:ubiquinone biosynthesis protein